VTPSTEARSHPTPKVQEDAEERRDCYWLYVVTDCDTQPRLHIHKDPARLPWHEVKKVDHYWLSVDAMKQAMRVRDDRPGGEGHEEP
jgi:nanoRNase/pAp phosphatase (c-di-AMP/oligoRNAs hydrolase)